jgi:hypothetical protein
MLKGLVPLDCINRFIWGKGRILHHPMNHRCRFLLVFHRSSPSSDNGIRELIPRGDQQSGSGFGVAGTAVS